MLITRSLTGKSSGKINGEANSAGRRRRLLATRMEISGSLFKGDPQTTKGTSSDNGPSGDVSLKVVMVRPTMSVKRSTRTVSSTKSAPQNWLWCSTGIDSLVMTTSQPSGAAHGHWILRTAKTFTLGDQKSNRATSYDAPVIVRCRFGNPE